MSGFNEDSKILGKKRRSRRRHSFLLTLFTQDHDKYEEKRVNGYWLVKEWNGSGKRWQVSIHDDTSMRVRKRVWETEKTRRDAKRRQLQGSML